jgi:LPXTG-motif cell wall-anchored protein
VDIAVVDPATGESDGGLLFALAAIVAAGSLVVLAFRWPPLSWMDRWVAPRR